MFTDLLIDLRRRAHAAAIDVFARNLRDLLLAAPAGARATLGLDPGIRTGCKIAVVDETGKLLDTATIYPFQPRNDLRGAEEALTAMIRRHGIALIAIGNGTASRESERLVADVIKRLPAGGPRPTSVIVSEAGASVYSASGLASREFPDIDVSLRGAVSIARRLQDPLAELVKIEPQAIGVGQYQHDVDQHRLGQSLAAVVEDAVNAVGVDLNMASAPLLSHVAGLGPSLAQAIVAHRDANGPFDTRKALLKVSGLGPKAFRQCAGFLRITDGAEPLDASSVHPEAYGVARRIVQACGRDIRAIMGDGGALAGLQAERFVDDSFGLPTVRDILSELEKPGRDPRPTFKTATFAEGIDSITDLKPGMSLEGTVTNVAAFGAFVDIGVHQDGLVHVSLRSAKSAQPTSRRSRCCVAHDRWLRGTAAQHRDAKGRSGRVAAVRCGASPTEVFSGSGHSAGGEIEHVFGNAVVRFEPVLAVNPACGIRRDGRSPAIGCGWELDGRSLRCRTFNRPRNRTSVPIRGRKSRGTGSQTQWRRFVHQPLRRLRRRRRELPADHGGLELAVPMHWPKQSIKGRNLDLPGPAVARTKYWLPGGRKLLIFARQSEYRSEITLQSQRLRMSATFKTR